MTVQYQIAYNFFKSWIKDGKYLKKKKDVILFLDKTMEPIAFINKNAIFGAVTRLESGRLWYTFASESLNSQFMLSSLTYSEERELMKRLSEEVFQ